MIPRSCLTRNYQSARWVTFSISLYNKSNEAWHIKHSMKQRVKSSIHSCTSSFTPDTNRCAQETITWSVSLTLVIILVVEFGPLFLIRFMWKYLVLFLLLSRGITQTYCLGYYKTFSVVSEKKLKPTKVYCTSSCRIDYSGEIWN